MKRFALLSALLLASTAHAADFVVAPGDVVVHRVKVDYQDLDLRQTDHADRLYQRLRYAARDACREHGRRDLAARSAEQRCVVAALDRAVRSIDKPLVTAAHEKFQSSKSG